MTCNFHVGQKVILVDAYSDAAHFFALLNGDILPIKGPVYTVSDIEPSDSKGRIFIRLHEISNPIPDGMLKEAAFYAARFRPLVERKTDISVFKSMLETPKVRIPA